jgi:hypothetical protein
MRKGAGDGMELEIEVRVAGAIGRTVEWAPLHGTDCDRAATMPLHVFLKLAIMRPGARA